MKCVNYRCLEHYDECESNGCNHFRDIEDCDCVLTPNQATLSGPFSVGLCAVKVKKEKTLSGWVQPYVSLRVGNFEFKRDYHTEKGAKNGADKVRELLGLEQGA